MSSRNSVRVQYCIRSHALAGIGYWTIIIIILEPYENPVYTSLDRTHIHAHTNIICYPDFKTTFAIVLVSSFSPKRYLNFLVKMLIIRKWDSKIQIFEDLKQDKNKNSTRNSAQLDLTRHCKLMNKCLKKHISNFQHDLCFPSWSNFSKILNLTFLLLNYFWIFNSLQKKSIPHSFQSVTKKSLLNRL